MVAILFNDGLNPYMNYFVNLKNNLHCKCNHNDVNYVFVVVIWVENFRFI